MKNVPCPMFVIKATMKGMKTKEKIHKKINRRKEIGKGRFAMNIK